MASFHRRPFRRPEPIPPPSEKVDVVVVSDEEFVPRAVRQLIERTQEDLKIFGLDCEWDLVSKKGVIHKPDILQIATVHGFCAIFRLHMLKTIPPELKGFLEDPYFAKVGVGVVEDRDKLKQSYDVFTEGVLDVRYLADDLDIPPRGLSHLTNTVLGVDLIKHHHSFHHWTGRLSYVQQQYAALDAIYSARVFYKMSHDRVSQVYGDEWQNWSHKEYHEKTLAMWNKYVSKNFDFTRCKFYKKKIIEFMLSLGDLTPKLRAEQNDEFATMAVEQLGPGEIQEFPTFQAKFASNKKKKKQERKEERLKKIPKRYLKRFIKKVEKQGVDPRTIPKEMLPYSVLDEDGKLDMSKI